MAGTEFATARGDDLRAFVERLLCFESTPGAEAPAQAWVEERLTDLGFETYRWEADPETLAAHPSFPDDPAEIPADGRPSVAGVLELGDPDAGPTLALNGHVDVVPVEGEWSGDPFDPRWDERGAGGGPTLTARGAADMKAGLGACVFAALHAAEAFDLDGRLVVESVAGEEDGGVGAAAAALDSPYPFERDAAVVAEPTDLTPVVACEGCLMVRIRVRGRSAHAATRWRGESVLPRLEAVREALAALEAERHERVRHPLYEEFPVRWPVVVGTVEAGAWPASVPAELEAGVRVGVAPGESVAEVERAVRERLATAAENGDDEWLRAHPPEVERFSVQFEPSEVDPETPVAAALRDAMGERGVGDPTPRGATYGTDARHFVESGTPAVVFGPGDIAQAHYPDETAAWGDVLDAGAVLAATAARYLG